MYTTYPNIIIGFHGCDKDVAYKILSKEIDFKFSINPYDWLGHGIYFWEFNHLRALEYAKELKKRNVREQKIKTPFCIGAVLDLGHCLNLINSESLKILKSGYAILEKYHKEIRNPLPENRRPADSTDMDFLLRYLDCAVIETIHKMNEINHIHPYDSVRGMFWEGSELYPNAGFKEKNHIQICIRNPNCIKGVFLPREFNEYYPKP